MKISPYLGSWQKRVFDLVVGICLLLILCPAIVAITVLIAATAGWPILFFQKRVGKNGHTFTMYKFRTMYNGANFDQSKYLHLNQANGPVFKIKNDPRFVGIGRWLSNTGLDELPQLFNVLAGTMSVVGPRPLPPNEEQNISSSIQKWRRLSTPGIISDWILHGCHKISFPKWMKTDEVYLCKASMRYDISIMYRVLTQQINSLFR